MVLDGGLCTGCLIATCMVSGLAVMFVFMAYFGQRSIDRLTKGWTAVADRTGLEVLVRYPGMRLDGTLDGFVVAAYCKATSDYNAISERASVKQWTHVVVTLPEGREYTLSDAQREAHGVTPRQALVVRNNILMHVLPGFVSDADELEGLIRRLVELARSL